MRSVSSVVFYSFARYFVTMVMCIVVRLVLMVSWFVFMFVVYLVLLNVVCFFSLGVYCVLSVMDVVWFVRFVMRVV